MPKYAAANEPGGIYIYIEGKREGGKQGDSQKKSGGERNRERERV